MLRMLICLRCVISLSHFYKFLFMPLNIIFFKKLLLVITGEDAIPLVLCLKVLLLRGRHLGAVCGRRYIYTSKGVLLC